MRNTLLLAIFLLNLSANTKGQDSFVKADYSTYFDWFNRQAPADRLYQDRAKLVIFNDETCVRQSPDLSADIVAILPIGQQVQNIAYDDYEVPADQIDGYGDIWFHVSGKDYTGAAFEGYVWGADIAKAQKRIDINQNGKRENVLLGVSSKARISPRGITAELKVLEDGTLLTQKTLPSLCVFGDCASNALIRSVPGQLPLLEISTMAMGCDEGIEKILLHWNDFDFDIVFHGEFTTATQFSRRPFTLQKGQVLTKQGIKAKICEYSHEDTNFNPVLECKTQYVKPEKPAGKVLASKKKPRA